jgi:hypothetical protein
MYTVAQKQKKIKRVLRHHLIHCFLPHHYHNLLLRGYEILSQMLDHDVYHYLKLKIKSDK